MARNGCVWVFLMCVSVAVKGEDYCRFGGDHTMCRYKGVGLKCSPRLSGGVSQTARSAILNAHNAFRQRVAQGQETRGAPGPQRPAANMRMMEWCPELAMVAQRWADQCDFKMDVCRSVAHFPSVAQSIYQHSSPATGTPPSPDWTTVITRWYDHVRDFDHAWIHPYVSNSAWYYSQIVWADTYKVGCGYTLYKNTHDPDCTHQFYGVGSKCSPQITGGVSQPDRAAIMHAHNAARQRVAQGQETRGAPGPQPPAANMRMMTWSNELSRVAQRWADQCDFKMDACRSVESQRLVTQAIYRVSSPSDVTSSNWPAVVTKWTDHVKSLNKTILDAFVHPSPGGLYTQIVWAETHLVGCGYSVYKEEGDHDLTHQFYVCNYAPGGNQKTARVYKKGAPCSKCPEGTSCRNKRFPSLCAVDIDSKEDLAEEIPTPTHTPRAE